MPACPQCSVRLTRLELRTYKYPEPADDPRVIGRLVVPLRCHSCGTEYMRVTQSDPRSAVVPIDPSWINATRS